MEVDFDCESHTHLNNMYIYICTNVPKQIQASQIFLQISSNINTKKKKDAHILNQRSEDVFDCFFGVKHYIIGDNVMMDSQFDMGSTMKQD